MSCDCSRLAYGAKLMLPLECKQILGPFNRALVLTDVVFDLWTYPNGAASKACGSVWNVLPNQWSRLLVGGWVTSEGRRYDLESGILCPKSSYLSICSCFFVNEPTALFQARVTGCFCENDHRPPIDPGPFADVAWDDVTTAPKLDPIDPSQSKSAADRAASFVSREVLASANRLANFDDANLRRSARAAVAAGARVERALEILGDEVPDHLRAAGLLRIENKQASLEELGQMHEPPLTKDAVAGRIRRLLATADKRAAELGIPNTEASLSAEMLEEE